MNGVVRRIDHVFVTADDAHSLFDLLIEKLGLFVVLPITDVGGFTSGAFNLGNIYLEILKAATWFPKPGQDGLEVNGIALEPEPTDQAISELDRRNIAHSPASPFEMPVLPEGTELPQLDIPVPEEMKIMPAPGTHVMTSFSFTDFIGGNAWVFCCEYLSGNPWHPIATARKAMRMRLDEFDGGPLGILGASEIVIGARDFEAESARWQQLLDPTKPVEPGLWSLGDGPKLRLVPNDRDAVLVLKLQTRSLDSAERFLRDQNILDSVSEGEAVIRPDAVGGLDLRVAL